MDIMESIRLLHENSAHFVLCSQNKQPIHKSWQKRKPSIKSILNHESLLGIIPFSIGMSALDVDHGDPSELIRHFNPIINIQSSIHTKRHLYYTDIKPRDNQKWEAFNCSGDIRSGNGYLILHKNAAIYVAKSLRVQLEFPFPGFLARLSDEKTCRISEQYAYNDLEHVQVGSRNNELFKVMQKFRSLQWSNGIRGKDELIKSCHDFAHKQNMRFRDPLPKQEVNELSFHAATSYHKFMVGRVLDRSMEAQRRRGLVSGRKRQLISMEHKFKAITMRDDGYTVPEIARHLGLSRQHIYKLFAQQNLRKKT